LGGRNDGDKRVEVGLPKRMKEIETSYTKIAVVVLVKAALEEVSMDSVERQGKGGKERNPPSHKWNSRHSTLTQVTVEKGRG